MRLELQLEDRLELIEAAIVAYVEWLEHLRGARADLIRLRIGAGRG